MSGPWDRPSPDPDAEWPTEDLESSGPAEPDRDAWSSGDLWPDSPRGASPGWDDWPSTTPPADYVADEPSPTLSDPWAESWNDESASGSAPSEPAWRPEPEPPPAPSWAEPRPEPSWPSEREPEPEAEPERMEAAREAETAPPEPEVERVEAAAEAETAPHVEPWTPDADPWGTAAPVEEPEPARTAHVPEPEPEPAAAEAEPEPVVTVEPEPEPAAAGPEPEPVEDVTPEPIADAESPVAADRPWPVFDWLPDLEPDTEPDPVVAAPDAASPPDEPAGDVDAAPPPDTVEPPIQPSPWAAGPWGEPEAEPAPPLAAAWDSLFGDAVDATAGERQAPQADEPPAGQADAPEPAESLRPAWLVDDQTPAESTQVLPTTWEPPPPPPPSVPAASELEPTAGSARTRLSEPETAEPDGDVEAQPSTAEQAVPWLIGFILLLAGMVIVLLALIFAGDESLGAGAPSPSPSHAVAVVTDSPTPSPSVASTPAPSSQGGPSAGPTPTPIPEYGPLEMVYQGRAAALAPIYLLRHDFTIEEEPATMAQDPALDVRRFAWAPDGRVGAGLLADVLVSIEPGAEKRRLGDGIATITFGADASTVYAVRITEDGGSDVVNVLAIDFTSGDTTELAAISYAQPTIGAEAALEEAQFADEGGAVRLYWMEDGDLRLWSLGGGSWTIDPDEGAVTELEEALPELWAPRGRQRIETSADGGTTTLGLIDADGDRTAETTIDGLVSHLRWSPDGERVAFTLGRSAAGGGVLQDLFLWDLGDGEAPTQLTNTGAAFGAEWLGATSLWRE